MTETELKNYLKKYNIVPTKKKGQNFLLDEEYLTTMLKAGAVGKTDVVLEIGPGLGILTKALSKKANKVLAIELDKRLSDLLQGELLDSVKNVDVITGDILSSTMYHQMVSWMYKELVGDEFHIDPDDESYQEVLETLDLKYKLIANLPYQITSRMLRQFLESKPRPSQLVVMVQKEVAERITANPGQMSLLSLSVQAYSLPVIVEIIPSSAYYPKPAVDSAIIHLDLTKPNENYIALSDAGKKMFWRLAKAGFSSKRKQLQNNLKSLLKDKSALEIVELLIKVGLRENTRAQELSVDDWCKVVSLVIDRGRD